MHYPKLLSEEIEEAVKYVNDMISAAEKQGALNWEVLYSLQKRLIEFSQIVNKNKDYDSAFTENWSYVWQWAPRFFDGDPFLDLLHRIGEYVPKPKQQPGFLETLFS